MQMETHTRETNVAALLHSAKRQEPHWQFFLRKLLLMNVGLAILSAAIVGTYKANIGASPWDVLHIGLTLHTSLSFGQASQTVGFAVLVFACWMGRKWWPPIGCLINIMMIGFYCDWLSPLIPSQEHWYWGLLQFVVAIVVMGYGVGIYIASDLGAGPRDWLMLSIHQKTGLAIRWVRTLIEVSAILIGVLLGGPFSVGTILFSLLIGHPTEWGLKWATRVFHPYVQRREWEHETID